MSNTIAHALTPAPIEPSTPEPEAAGGDSFTRSTAIAVTEQGSGGSGDDPTYTAEENLILDLMEAESSMTAEEDAEEEVQEEIKHAAQLMQQAHVLQGHIGTTSIVDGSASKTSGSSPTISRLTKAAALSGLTSNET